METNENKPRSKKLTLFGIIGLVLVVLLFLSKNLFFSGFDIQKTAYLYIDDKKDYNHLLAEFQDSAHIDGVWIFKSLSSTFGYSKKMKMGRYAVRPGEGILSVFRKLRNGSQDPVRLTFNNIRTKSELINKIGSQFMFGKKGLSTMLNDEAVCKKYALDTNTVVCLFVPDTYEIYWTVKPDAFLSKMEKAYDHFWNATRTKKLAEVNLTKAQVMTLASIVEEECTYSDEYPMVAGLYLNRLRSGQPLQADPTVKYAVNDFSLRRILTQHLQVESPYNTYKHTGLPPGPIRIPSSKAIDGVLNYAHHNYLYMCAKEDFSGRHNFATTFAEHHANAERYREALDKRNIK